MVEKFKPTDSSKKHANEEMTHDEIEQLIIDEAGSFKAPGKLRVIKESQDQTSPEEVVIFFNNSDSDIYEILSAIKDQKDLEGKPINIVLYEKSFPESGDGEYIGDDNVPLTEEEQKKLGTEVVRKFLNKKLEKLNLDIKDTDQLEIDFLQYLKDNITEDDIELSSHAPGWDLPGMRKFAKSDNVKMAEYLKQFLKKTNIELNYVKDIEDLPLPRKSYFVMNDAPNKDIVSRKLLELPFKYWNQNIYKTLTDDEKELLEELSQEQFYSISEYGDLRFINNELKKFDKIESPEKKEFIASETIKRFSAEKDRNNDFRFNGIDQMAKELSTYFDNSEDMLKKFQDIVRKDIFGNSALFLNSVMTEKFLNYGDSSNVQSLISLGISKEEIAEMCQKIVNFRLGIKE